MILKKLKKGKNINLIHMGDSITFGQHIPSQYRWTDLLEERWKQIYMRTDVEIKVYNRGVSGETTRMGLERFPCDLQDLSPDVVTIQFGMNDCNCWQTDKGLPRVSERAFEANMVEMVRRSRHFGAEYVILINNHKTLRYTSMVSGESYENANIRYSQLIKKVAFENKTHFFDMRKVFEKYNDEQLEKLLLPYPDQLHLSIDGNRIYADAIFPLLSELLENTVQQHVEKSVNE